MGKVPRQSTARGWRAGRALLTGGRKSKPCSLSHSSRLSDTRIRVFARQSRGSVLEGVKWTAMDGRFVDDFCWRAPTTRKFSDGDVNVGDVIFRLKLGLPDGPRDTNSSSAALFQGGDHELNVIFLGCNLRNKPIYGRLVANWGRAVERLHAPIGYLCPEFSSDRRVFGQPLRFHWRNELAGSWRTDSRRHVKWLDTSSCLCK